MKWVKWDLVTLVFRSYDPVHYYHQELVIQEGEDEEEEEEEEKETLNAPDITFIGCLSVQSEGGANDGKSNNTRNLGEPPLQV